MARGKPMGTRAPLPHAEWFADEATRIEQHDHMDRHHRAELVLFLSRAGAIERHTAAHRREREALEVRAT
jgi:hypothetical protein